MAESADALASGASGGNPVKVQILSPAPSKCYRLTEIPSACFVFLGSGVELISPQNGGLFNQASVKLGF